MPGHGRPGGRRGRAVTAATFLFGGVGAALLGLSMLAADRAPPQPPPAAGRAGPLTPPGPDRSQAVSALPRSVPVALSAPAIHLHTRSLTGLGLRRDGSLEAPADWDTAGYYRDAPTPGEVGPAIIVGHVDSKAGPAVFYRLGDLRPGDMVAVRRADRKTAVFSVYAVERYPKDRFPTEAVYGDTHRPELRLITCGGSFDQTTGHYRDNIVVYASLTEGRTPSSVPAGASRPDGPSRADVPHPSPGPGRTAVPADEPDR